MLIVTSCRPNGKSSSRAKPRRYSNTSFAEGIFSRWTVVAPRTRRVTLKELPSGSTSSTSARLSCSTTFIASKTSISGSSPSRSLATRAASTSSPLATVVSEMPRPNCFTSTLRRRWRRIHSSSDGKRTRTVFTPPGVRRLMAIGLVESNTGVSLIVVDPFLLADGIHVAFRDRRDDAVGCVVDRRRLHRDRNDLFRLAHVRRGERNLLPRDVERIVGVELEMDHCRAGGLR